MFKTTQPVAAQNPAPKPVPSEWVSLAGVCHVFAFRPQRFVNQTQPEAIPDADAETLHEFLKEILLF
ncbi:MAG: hypothetical protein ONB43_20015 [candidate division KSB1 bacterium]|nr:hypothetical protein [candidate division KSB1 bacterium]